MGITVATGKTGPVADPNIVPLIDVLLVLIIIFMVITPKTPSGLVVLVPQPPQSKPEPPEPRTIVVRVIQNDKLMINADQTDWDTLGSRLSDIFKQRADKVAFVEGANEVSFAQVARVIDIMRGAGIDRVGLLTPGIMLEGKDPGGQPQRPPI